MGLLQQIIEDAAGNGPVSEILRRLKVLAKRIGAEDTLLPWVVREIEGYPPDVEVPDYRKPVRLHPHGTFTNGACLPVRHDAMPENWRIPAQFEFQRTQPIAVIEGLASDGGVALRWSAEAVSIYNGRIEREEAGLNPLLNCVGVKSELNRHAFEAVLDAVRNKALDLALELEDVAPDVGEVGVPDDVNTAARQVTNNYFIGTSLAGSNNTFGGTDINQMITAAGGGPGE